MRENCDFWAFREDRGMGYDAGGHSCIPIADRSPRES